MGRKLHSTGRLDPDGVELALANLPRFAAAAEALGVERLRVVGTAAIRDASDGAAFIARVREAAGLRIEIISGETEARLSAMGLLSAVPDADGAMGDLGGGSLELARLDKGALGPQVTLPLGPLRLNEAEREGGNIGKLIKESLQGLRWLPDLKGRSFHAIGGAWRALARIHQAHTGYRLRVIDGYSVEAPAFRDFLQLVGKMSEPALRQLPDVPSKRLDTLRPAARILRHIVNIGAPAHIVFSTQGLREGVIFEDLPEPRRREEPLLAAAADIARHFGRFARLGPGLARWTEPLFRSESRAERRLREAACLLSDIGWVDHPDYRGRLVFERALTMPLPGLDHRARAFIAHALHARYEDEPGNRARKTAAALGLADEAMLRARAIGQAIRLGYTVATGREDVLAKTTLAAGEKLLILSVPRLDGTYAGESVSRRLDQLARAMGLAPRLAVRGG
jgi:exopolyphosphatase/guanosine-5'-triphosphate,3'-diphosphate pyrophosphatase